jgi:hypothetical protein
VRLAAIALVVTLFAPVGASAAPQDATARALLAAWKDQDPSARLAAELIAGAFASGLANAGKPGEKELICPPSNLDAPPNCWSAGSPPRCYVAYRVSSAPESLATSSSVSEAP